MTENQNQEPTLEQRLLGIGQTVHTYKSIIDSENPEQRNQHYENLASLMSGQKKGEQYWDAAYQNIIQSPERAIGMAKENVGTRSAQVKELYKEKKDKIVDFVISLMNKEVESSKTGDEVALKLSAYFTRIFDIPKLDQVTANRYANTETARILGVSTIYGQEGSIEQYKNYHSSLSAREFAGIFIKEEKDKDGKVTYVLEKEKVKELMNDITNASILYTNALHIKKVKDEKNSKKD